MNSGYERKSPQELKARARMNMQTAEQIVPCVAVTEENWAAMIGLQKTQNEMLSEIMERQTKLTTQAELGKMLSQQSEVLMKYTQSCEGLTQEYTEQMAQNVTDFTKQMNTVMKDISTQAGKMSESFSQSLSSEQETVRAFRKRCMLISLIPTVLLILWELIRHIFLLT